LHTLLRAVLATADDDADDDGDDGDNADPEPCAEALVDALGDARVTLTDAGGGYSSGRGSCRGNRARARAEALVAEFLQLCPRAASALTGFGEWPLHVAAAAAGRSPAARAAAWLLLAAAPEAARQLSPDHQSCLALACGSARRSGRAKEAACRGAGPTGGGGGGLGGGGAHGLHCLLAALLAAAPPHQLPPERAAPLVLLCVNEVRVWPQLYSETRGS
jgi:hypothetical protein